MPRVLITIFDLYPSLIALKQQNRYVCFLLLFFPSPLPEGAKHTFLFKLFVVLLFVCVNVCLC